VPSYRQFCPVARRADVFAERRTPLIIRELLNGSRRFSELQLGLPQISRNLLTRRLDRLVRAGILARRKIGGRPDAGNYVPTFSTPLISLA